MLGLTGVVIALVVLTILLAGVFLIRPSFTVGVTGKILAFVGLCILPTLCIATGMSFHMQRSEQTAYCISCHSMETHGQSLYVLNTNYIPAQHFQNHLVPPDKACYTCHTNYTMYGPVKDKLKGLKYLYMEYVSTPPKTIHLDGTYSNLQCLHCHTGMRTFDANPTHTAIMGSLKTNQIACISCHNTIHNASEVSHLKMWVDGDTPTSVAVAPASPEPGTAEPAATAAPSKPIAGGSAGVAATGGKAIFDSQRCGVCHGATGGGATGPALTHTSSQYPPAKLTAVLKAPTAKMKAGGMTPLTLNAADMKSLVSYVDGLGGPSIAAAKPSAVKSASTAPTKAKPAANAAPSKAAPATAPPAAAPTSPAPAKAEPPATAATAAPAAKAAPATTPPAVTPPSPAPAKGESGATAAPSKAPATASASPAVAARGKSIFDSQRCNACHGASGGGGPGPALTHTSGQYPPAKLTAILKKPTAKMKAAGMTPLTLNVADMKELVSYVGSLGGTSAAPAAKPLDAGSAPPVSTKAQPADQAKPSKPQSKLKRALRFLFSPC